MAVGEREDEPSKVESPGAGLSLGGALFTLIAAVIVAVTWAQMLGSRWSYPNLWLSNPPRALFHRAELERRAALSQSAPDSEDRKLIEAHGIASITSAWQALVDEEVRWDSEFVPSAQDLVNRRGTAPAFLVEAAYTTVEYLVAAPFGEELLFRGVLFGALLTRATGASPSGDVRPRMHRAMCISAVLFSLWHGYGLLGSLEVAIGGYLLARLYAYTGSLLPCMIVHSCMNLLPLLYGLAARA